MNCAKLENMEARYMSLEDKLSDPSVIADQEAWRRFSKEHAEMTDIIDTFRRWKKITASAGKPVRFERPVSGGTARPG